MSPRYPQKNNIEKYKVMIPESNGSGELGEPLGKFEIGYPGDSSTTTFIGIGSFDTLEEAQNCEKYLKSKLVRCLLGILKITQHNPQATWAYVPMQDFTKNSNIDWSQTVAEIDKQLYKIYGLDKPTEEGYDLVKFIEEKVTPMD